MFVHAVYFWLKQDLRPRGEAGVPSEAQSASEDRVGAQLLHRRASGDAQGGHRSYVGMEYVWTASDRGDRIYSLFNFAWNLGFVNSFIAWKENEQCPRRLNPSAP